MRTNAERYRVLLLEDDPAEARQLCGMLDGALPRRFEFCKRVDNLEEARKCILSSQADLLLLDLRLLECEGLEAFLELHESAPHFPVIVFGESENEALSLRLMEEGAQDYIVRRELNAGSLQRMMQCAIARQEAERLHAWKELERANADLLRSREELFAAVGELQAVHLRLIEAEKLELVGRLAAGIAHEVKNPLGIIGMGVEYLKEKRVCDPENRDDPEVAAVLAEITCAVGRADQIVRGLLDFSAPKALSLDVLDLNEVIRQGLLLIGGERRRGRTEIVEELDPGLPPVRGDAMKMEQVFINLFTNAVHAMERGGTLTVRTYTRQAAGIGGADAPGGEGLPPLFLPGERVAVAEILDTGHGFPEEIRERAFDPFFTTKPRGKGTGLGLTVSKSIVDLHRGAIQIRNRPEGGACVTLLLRTEDLP